MSSVGVGQAVAQVGQTDAQHPFAVSELRVGRDIQREVVGHPAVDEEVAAVGAAPDVHRLKDAGDAAAANRQGERELRAVQLGVELGVDPALEAVEVEPVLGGEAVVAVELVYGGRNFVLVDVT